MQRPINPHMNSEQLFRTVWIKINPVICMFISYAQMIISYHTIIINKLSNMSFY